MRAVVRILLERVLGEPCAPDEDFFLAGPVGPKRLPTATRSGRVAVALSRSKS